jgi:hypothetical protein
MIFGKDTGNEMDISSEAVEFRNDQGRSGLLGSGNGSRQLGSIRPPAALDFAKFPANSRRLARLAKCVLRKTRRPASRFRPVANKGSRRRFSCPILFGFPLHRRRIRVLELEPAPAPPTSVMNSRRFVRRKRSRLRGDGDSVMTEPRRDRKPAASWDPNPRMSFCPNHAVE